MIFSDVLRTRNHPQVILLQELFATKYFCQEQKEEHFLLAESEGDSPLLRRFQGLAKELGVVSARPQRQIVDM